MFEVGFTEIILILGLALLVLGPERLPDLAAKVGRWTGKARAMARQFQSQLEQEVTLDNISKASNPPYTAPTHSDTTSPTDPSMVAFESQFEANAGLPPEPPPIETTAAGIDGPQPEPDRSATHPKQ
jgi:sec-independent protein translocase protein TatB